EDSQIHPPDEETETFGLFDQEIEEENDEKLAYSLMIRAIKEKTPGLLKQIKNMPLRARAGRENKALNRRTIRYSKHSKRDDLIWVKDNEETEELTFLETVKIFEADVLEKAIPLHSKHHEQVKAGSLLFSDLLEKEKAKDKKIDTTQGPNEKKANAYLDAKIGRAHV